MDDDQPLLGGDETVEESSRNKKFEEYVQPVAAEFLSTAIFVFIATASVVQGDIHAIAVAHGFTIAILVITFGQISGAHINPAVTLGFIIAGGITWLKAIFYVLAQLIGGIVGAALTRGMLSFQVAGNTTMYEHIKGGGHFLGPGVSVAEGVLGEIALTTILVIVILMCAYDSNGTNLLHPLAIGFAIVVDILAAGGITGGSMNPARSFGPAVVLSSLSTTLWTNHWIYWVGPAIGASIAGLFYRLIFANNQKRLFK